MDTDRYTLPVAAEYVRNRQDPGDVEMFAVFNVVPDFYEFLRVARRRFRVEEVVAVPDTLDESAATLIERNLDVDVARTGSVEEVHHHVRRYFEERSRDGPTVVLDVGGHCVEPLLEVDTSDVLGVVEDTNFGHWKYEDADLSVPVVSIAQAPVKALENRVVGDAVMFSLENVLRNAFERELFSEDVLVLGYGNVGSSVADALDRRRATVHVYDVDPVRSAMAYVDGYAVGPREALLGRCEVVVGATGQSSVTYDDFEHLPDGCILASATSGTAEFDLEGFYDDMVVADSGNHWTELEADGSTLVLLNEGEPVNFIDTSVSTRVLDVVYGALLAGLFQISHEDLPAGLHEVDDERVRTVVTEWLETYG